jgi:peptidoglycan/LPS O-acetylase OafA/YrhL
LRGIAALAVVLYHFDGAIRMATDRWLPQPLEWVAAHGANGVDVFFVISGFVIAYSVRNGSYTFGYLLRFMVRRSIRLDPPYWVAIAIEIALLVLTPVFFPSIRTPVISVAQVLSHLVYAQNILGYGDLDPVFWTLCFEVQFYSFFVGSLVAWQALRRLKLGRSVAVAYFGAVFVLSLALRYGGVSIPHRGLALGHWFEFFLGVLTWWTVSKGVSPRWIGAALIAATVAILAARVEIMNLMPVGVTLLLLVVAWRGALETFLGGAVFQFFGRISYSLYLFHAPIGWRWISLLERVHGGRIGPLFAWFEFASAAAVTVGISAITWRLIESPSMKFSKRIGLPPRDRPRPVVQPGEVLVPTAPAALVDSST